jgi:hypothetical protein
MIDRTLVYKVIRRILRTDKPPGMKKRNPAEGKDVVVSLLIHDVFGGEILKTKMKSRWYFYNRIDGKRLDFTRKQQTESSGDYCFEDIPSSPSETYRYVEKEEYSTFLMRFIMVFEEAVGLKKPQQELAT